MNKQVLNTSQVIAASGSLSNACPGCIILYPSGCRFP